MPERARDYKTIVNSLSIKSKYLLELINNCKDTFCIMRDEGKFIKEINQAAFLDKFIINTKSLRNKDFSDSQKKVLLDILMSYTFHEDHIAVPSSKQIEKLIKELHDYHKMVIGTSKHMHQVYHELKEKSDISVLGIDLYDQITAISDCLEDLQFPLDASINDFANLEKNFNGRMGNPTKETELWIRQAVARLRTLFLEVSDYKAAPPKNYNKKDDDYYITSPYFKFLQFFFKDIVPKYQWDNAQRYLTTIIKDGYLSQKD